MQIKYDPRTIQLGELLVRTLQDMVRSGSSRHAFHKLVGYDTLYAITIPGTGNRGRLILKHLGEDVYQVVFMDETHSYKKATLDRLESAQTEKDGLGALEVIIEERSTDDSALYETEPTMYSVREKLVVLTQGQLNIGRHIYEFAMGETGATRNWVVEGVPGSGKTLAIEIALRKIVEAREQLLKNYKCIWYVAPTLHSIKRMQEYIQSIPGGDRVLDSKIIRLSLHSDLVEELTHIPSITNPKILLIIDEAQGMMKEHLDIVSKYGGFVALGDVEQAQEDSSVFQEILKSGPSKTSVCRLTDNYRCPPDVVSLGNEISSLSHKLLKVSGVTKGKDGLRASSASGRHTQIENVKFYDAKFLDNTGMHSTEVAYIAFNKAKKEELTKNGKINTFEALEVQGLEFPHVVIVLDIKALQGFSPKKLNGLYVAITRTTGTVYLDVDLLNYPGSDLSIASGLAYVLQERYGKANIVSELCVKASSTEKLIERAIFYLENNHEYQARQIGRALAKSPDERDNIAAALRAIHEAKSDIATICAQRVLLSKIIPSLTHQEFLQHHAADLQDVTSATALFDLDPVWVVGILLERYPTILENTGIQSRIIEFYPDLASLKSKLGSAGIPHNWVVFNTPSFERDALPHPPKQTFEELKKEKVTRKKTHRANPNPVAPEGYAFMERVYSHAAYASFGIELLCGAVRFYHYPDVKYFHSTMNALIQPVIILLPVPHVANPLLGKALQIMKSPAAAYLLRSVIHAYVLPNEYEEREVAVVIMVLSSLVLWKYRTAGLALLTLSHAAYAISNVYSLLFRELPHEAFYHAITSNDTSKIAMILKQDQVSFGVKFLSGTTPLEEAMRFNNTQVLKGYDNLRYKFFLSLERGYVTEVNKYLERGADVNAKFLDGFTPLEIAVLGGHTEIVKVLLERGADVNAESSKGATALLLASQEGHTEIVKVLLEKGADVNAKSPDGFTPLEMAKAQGHIMIVALLIEKKNTRESLLQDIIKESVENTNSKPVIADDVGNHRAPPSINIEGAEGQVSRNIHINGQSHSIENDGSFSATKGYCPVQLFGIEAEQCDGTL